ncbi:MAG: hypothetical protein COB26_10695 [Piscirickettsiaceae bacterium]|nr:MAG: hypothetical protein COB89_05045 [Piscirickettsiaceae bacterium]PCI66913.1 MAG: hypothetical protein COB26_10695 [Piscirickettsiaceae bacterium]
MSKKVNMLAVVLTVLALTACADMSMYNQVPAPVGQAGRAPAEVNTYPIESPSFEAIEDQYVPNPTQSTTIKNPAVIALLGDARQKRQQGEFSVAASKLERAVRIAPRDGEIWYELASIRLQQGRYQSAESLAKKSILYSAKNYSLLQKNWLLIARSRDEQGQTASAKLARIEARKFR